MVTALDRVCATKGCGSKVLAKGLCSSHYHQLQRHGDSARPAFGRLEDRFWRKVEKTDSCWLWRGALVGGYGQFRVGAKAIPSHRWSFEQECGPVPDGLELDHLCRVRACVRPSHLEPVTHKENTLRGTSFSAIEARQTHCKNGHAFDASNTLPRSGGGRRCLACKRDAGRRYWRRKNGWQRDVDDAAMRDARGY